MSCSKITKQHIDYANQTCKRLPQDGLDYFKMTLEERRALIKSYKDKRPDLVPLIIFVQSGSNISLHQARYSVGWRHSVSKFIKGFKKCVHIDEDVSLFTLSNVLLRDNDSV